MPAHSYHFSALGTKWVIETRAELPDGLKNEIGEWLERFDQNYSRFRDDSLVRQMADSAGTFAFPDSANEIIGFYKKLYDVTDGKVTPLIGRTLESAGYDKNYSLQSGFVASTPGWDTVMKWQGSQVVTTTPLVLDIGAAGKGYAVDAITSLLDSYTINDYVVDASGDIRHRGSDMQRIGLENPTDTSKVIGVIELQNASLCASASNRRKWGDWNHIIDPTNNTPVEDIVATWVVAESAMVADGLATALFFVGPEKLAQWQFQYVRLYASGRAEYSPKLNGELFV